MNPRILVNLVIFGVLAVVMLGWAFRNVTSFDFIDKPYRLTAEFASSPGLRPGFEVDYLGLRVGKIDSVDLLPGKVRVKLDIDRGTKIPQGVRAVAARKSAVGEPVVELTPAPGQGRAAALAPGSVIPVSHTSVPPKYGELFKDVNKALKAFDPADLRTLTHELAKGWNGRSDSLREIIAGTDQLTGTFASNTELIDGLIGDFGKITHVLAQNRGALGEGIDNAAVLTRSLREVRTELAALRDRGPGLIGQVNKFIDEGGRNLDCVLQATGDFLPGLSSPANLQYLRKTLSLAPELLNVLNTVIRGESLSINAILTLRKLSAEEYKNPRPNPPGGGKIPVCADGRRPSVSKQKPVLVSATPSSPSPSASPSAEIAAPAARNASEQTPVGPPAWLVYVPPGLALLILIKVMAGSVQSLSRSRRRED